MPDPCQGAVAASQPARTLRLRADTCSVRPLVGAVFLAAIVSAGCSGTAERPTSPVAPSTTATSRAVSQQDVVAALEARRLRLYRAGAACPASSVRTVALRWSGPTGGIFGVGTRLGPVILLLSEESVPIPRIRVDGRLYVDRAVVRLGPSSVRGWGALKTVWLSEPSYRGPVLVRGRRLDGTGPVGIGVRPAEKRFVMPAGPDINGGNGYRPGIGYVWLKRTGCYGFQIDGTTFSHEVVVDVLSANGAR